MGTHVRTLGLVHERGNEYSVFYTGFESEPNSESLQTGKGLDTFCAIGLARVALGK